MPEQEIPMSREEATETLAHDDVFTQFLSSGTADSEPAPLEEIPNETPDDSTIELIGGEEFIKEVALEEVLDSNTGTVTQIHCTVKLTPPSTYSSIEYGEVVLVDHNTDLPKAKNKLVRDVSSVAHNSAKNYVIKSIKALADVRYY